MSWSQSVVGAKASQRQPQDTRYSRRRFTDVRTTGEKAEVLRSQPVVFRQHHQTALTGHLQPEKPLRVMDTRRETPRRLGPLTFARERVTKGPRDHHTEIVVHNRLSEPLTTWRTTLNFTSSFYRGLPTYTCTAYSSLAAAAVIMYPTGWLLFALDSFQNSSQASNMALCCRRCSPPTHPRFPRLWSNAGHDCQRTRGRRKPRREDVYTDQVVLVSCLKSGEEHALPRVWSRARLIKFLAIHFGRHGRFETALARVAITANVVGPRERRRRRKLARCSCPSILNVTIFSILTNRVKRTISPHPLHSMPPRNKLELA